MRKRIQAAASAAALLLVGLALPPAARASGFPVFVNDPVNSSTGRPYPVLPGTPLILPQPDGRFDPPIVDSSIIGDVDLVVRAGTMMAGPSIPPPSDSPRTAVAGGAAMAGGSEIPFTVVVSDGSSAPPSGNPLLGPEMDGIPVVVAAFADLDGDGVVGPTNADDAGAADDARELQESNYLVGRQVAIFHNGVAQGTLAVWKGAPASAGGLRVVLTAFAYVGPFSPGFFFGSVPDGPPIATRLPFFPRYDPNRVVEGNGRGGRADPEHRLGVEMEPAFDPPVDDPTLDTPFALPTDGSSPTIDRVVVYGGPLSRMRFVRSSSSAGFPVGTQMPLHPGAGGALYEPMSSVDVPDNGPGATVPVRLIPVDALDNVTDPPPGAQATIVAGPGLVISAPDTDGNPSRETVPVASAAGVDVTLDDAGGAGDSGAGSTITVAFDGVPVETLAVRFVPVAAATKIVEVGPGGTLTFFDEESGTDTTTVMVGDTVKWVWQSSGHSTTRAKSPEAWNSDVQAAPFSFTHRFMTPGTYPYHCIRHQFPGMVGTVVVLPATATTTTLPPSGPTTTTTTITLPPEIAARFDSIKERLAGLGAAVDAAQLVAEPQRRLAQRVQRAGQGTKHARGLLTLGRRRAAKGSLRQAMRSLLAFEIRVRALMRRQRVSPETGALLLGTADSTRNDLGALLHSV